MDVFRFLTVLVWILYGMGVLVYAVLAEEYDRILVFKEPASDKTFNGHVIRTENVADEGSCRVKCYLEPNCVSVNVGPQEKGSHVCELNNATDESPTLSGLLKRKSYTYHGIENPCHSNPCLGKRDMCQVGFTDRGFRCVCRKSYREKQCGKNCLEPLGMENGAICDGQISASSEWDVNHAARQGRLNFKAHGKFKGAWSAANSDVNPWLQIYLGSESIIITRLATQGRNGFTQWVTSYNLQYSDDRVNFRYYREQGATDKKVFNGNTDQDTVVYHELNPPIRARYIRFRPVARHIHISMRVELYGCSKACPSYWRPFGASFYAVISIPKSWTQAEAFCKLMDARLAKIESNEENAFIESIASLTNAPYGYWIGLTDAGMENHWKWSDGSSLGLYTNWGTNEPNNINGEDCVTFFS
ncbi:EGF-like repeat and discoidin I-like domain-containing protein 3 isoform X1 [Oculina patagonica]